MEWLPVIFEMCLIPLIGVLTVYLVNLIKTKTQETQAAIDNDLLDKYIGLFGETVSNCVLATSQTYVESLKKQGKFDAEAQKIAFQMSYDAIMETLSEEAKIYLTEIYGDLRSYLTKAIEAEVNRNK